MTDKELRVAFLKNPSAYRSAALSREQLELYGEVLAYGQLTSGDAANIFGISVQSASGRLATLKKKGYLCREERLAESGGIEFIYFTERLT